MKTFRGKTAVVTGGGSGIGRALALELAQAGARVLITDCVPERVDRVVSELRARGADAAGWRVDHARRDETAAFAAQAWEEGGGVDILCLNAGVGHGARVEDTAVEDWEWLIGVNLWGTVYMVHEFVPRMIRRRQGWILITASGLGLIPAPGMAPYVTSKYAMVGLGESLRTELAAHNIKVSVLCPGIIKTNIVEDGRIHMSDRAGGSAKPKVAGFYATRGADPAVAARDGLRALARDIGIMPTPLHTWPMYLLHRVSPGLYHGLARLIWKKGWLV